MNVLLTTWIGGALGAGGGMLRGAWTGEREADRRLKEGLDPMTGKRALTEAERGEYTDQPFSFRRPGAVTTSLVGGGLLTRRLIKELSKLKAKRA